MDNGRDGAGISMIKLVFPIALLAIVGIGQIAFALRALEERKANWFVAIIVVGMLLNMAILVYTVTNSIKRTRDLRKSQP